MFCRQVCLETSRQGAALQPPRLPRCTPFGGCDQPACREAYCTTGYSPVLTFDVEDLQVWQHGALSLLPLGLAGRRATECRPAAAGASKLD